MYVHKIPCVRRESAANHQHCRNHKNLQVYMLVCVHVPASWRPLVCTGVSQDFHTCIHAFTHAITHAWYTCDVCADALDLLVSAWRSLLKLLIAQFGSTHACYLLTVIHCSNTVMSPSPLTCACPPSTQDWVRESFQHEWLRGSIQRDTSG